MVVMMTSFRVLILLLAVSFDGLASARDAACARLPAIFPALLPENACQCGDALANARLTPPKGLRLVAACGLTWGHEKKIDLSTTRIELNTYTQGDYPLGTLYLAGPIELRGTAWVAPEEDSDSEHGPGAGFSVHWPARETQTAFLHLIGDLSFQDGTTEKALRMDRALSGKLAGKRCAIADARIRVQGLMLTNDDSDAQGAYALGVKVLEISPYRACPPGGPLADRLPHDQK